MSKRIFRVFGTNLARAELAPVIKFAGIRGNISAIAQEMEIISGEPFAKQEVDRWLTEDETRWVEPKHGTAILLKQAVRTLKLKQRDARIQARNFRQAARAMAKK